MLYECWIPSYGRQHSAEEVYADCPLDAANKYIEGRDVCVTCLIAVYTTTTLWEIETFEIRQNLKGELIAVYPPNEEDNPNFQHANEEKDETC